MSKSKLRKGLSKKIRFEVFKRDKFTCQYCGEKAPNVLLQVDHIEPVAKGGINEIANLITSCFNCNSGKRDRQLSDDSVVEKQRKQLELLQERREQIELMFEWKKSLSQLDGETIDMIIEYIDSKMPPFTINENGEKTIGALLKKFTIDKILDAIDLSANKYLKISKKGELDKENVELFIQKIGGILHLQTMPPIQQKLAYIKGIAKNRFNYFDVRRASIYLNDYIKALRNDGYNDEQVLTDLEEELMPKTIEANNWTEWTGLLEGWTDSLNKRKTEEPQREQKEYSYEQLKSFAQFTLAEIEGKEKVLVFLAKEFSDFNAVEFRRSLYSSLYEYLEEIEEFDEQQLMEYRNEDLQIDFISKFSLREDLIKSFVIDWTKNESVFYSELDSIIRNLINEIFENFYFPSTNYSRKDILIQVNIIKDYLSKELQSSD